MAPTIENFVQSLVAFNDTDYGDFMRESNVHLDHLCREIPPVGDSEINKKLVEMKLYLQYSPNWDIESTRARLIQDAKYLDELINAHNQDWESASI